MTSVGEIVVYRFIRVLTRRLADKGVFTDREITELLDAWFGEVMALGRELQESGSTQDVDDILQMIHSLTVEFAPK